MNRPTSSAGGWRLFSPLRHPGVAWYFAGKTASTFGIWVQNITSAILMYDITGSAVMVGLVSTFQFTPTLVLAPVAGTFSDQFDRRKVLLFGRLTSAVTVLLLSALVASQGTDDLRPIALLIFVGCLGIAASFSIPAMQALVPALVPPRDLEPALALSSAIPSLGRTVGPALGAILLAVGGPALAYAFCGCAHLLLVTALLFVRPRDHQRRRQKPKYLAGARYLVTDRGAAAAFLAVVFLGFGTDAAVTLAPPMARELGEPSSAVGLIASSFGLGAIVGTAVLARTRRLLSLVTTSAVGYGLLAGGLSLTALAPTLSMASTTMGIAGVGFMLGTATQSTYIQERVPDELRGRVMALWGVAFAGSRPIAAMITSAIAETTSIRIAYAATAVATLLALPMLRRSGS